jgi:outer membrane lipopolysaccharide assembly protein LptE/RlpB
MDELKIFRAVTFNDTDVLATQDHEEFHIKDINKQLAIRVIQKLQDVELR